MPATNTDAVFSVVSVGNGYTCGVTGGKNVRCWGETRLGPLYFSGDYTQVAATGDFYTCGLTAGGAVHCWSALLRYLPDLPIADDGDPDTEDDPFTFSQIASTAGSWVSCGLQDDQNGQTAGAVRCWMSEPNSTPIGYATAMEEVIGNTTFSAISLELQTFCGILRDAAAAGKPQCYRTYYSSTTPAAVTIIPTEVAGAKVSRISAGRFFACTLLRDGDNAGEMRCWGQASYVTELLDVIPADDDNVTFTAVSASSAHVCAIKSDATVACYGPNSTNNDFGQAIVPVDLVAATFSYINTGPRHTCGILDGQNGQTAGAVRCWGAENYDTLYSNSSGVYNHGQTVPYEQRAGFADFPALPTSPGALDAGYYQTCGRTPLPAKWSVGERKCPTNGMRTSWISLRAPTISAP